jgi:hypothetical protein
MSVELSRKYSWIKLCPSIQAHSYEKFMEMARHIEDAPDYDALPQWVKVTLELAEKEKPDGDVEIQAMDCHDC